MIVLAVVAIAGVSLSASPSSGLVTFGGLPVPGATITASRDDQRIVTISDAKGAYTLPNLADGPWTITVEMLGFSTTTRDVMVGPDVQPLTWELALLPFEEITKGAQSVAREPSAGPAPSSAPPQKTAASAPFQRAEVTASTATPVPPAAATAAPEDPDLAQRAAEGLLVNGSVNNGAATPFAQLAAFGNNRRGVRSLYNGGFGFLFGNSAFDARPFSFTSVPSLKPSYGNAQLVGTFGGPIKIPGVLRNHWPNVVIAYQHLLDHNAVEQSAVMPTAAERLGDFSRAHDGFGRPLQIIDPRTGLPFPGGVIPPGRITTQASTLLAYYPQPNTDGVSNYQRPVLASTSSDDVQARVTEVLDTRNQLFGNVSFHRATTDTTSIFGFVDTTRATNLDTAANWSHRIRQFNSIRVRYQFTRMSNENLAFFSNRINVSGDAGINGNNQEPINWGPPTLIFSSGIAGLSDAVPTSTIVQTHTLALETLWIRGRHNLTIGGGFHRQHVDLIGQQDPRGTFSFTGATTGSDFADFLLGFPHTASVAFANADKYLRAVDAESYVSDDWRIGPSLTVTGGVRWEYESPMTEAFGRLVNLQLTPGFTAMTRVSGSMLHADWRGLQPRVGMAWRPIPASSVVVRASYGVYRNTSVYQPIATLLAQQPQAPSAPSAASNALTLATGLATTSTANALAVDPDFRVGYAHNWQVSLQRDLPASLTIIASYLGAHGSHLPQEFLPNTYPVGAVNPCLSCPVGFVYLTSNGTSSREAAQLELRRRLRNGLTARVQYTLANAEDDAGAIGGVSLLGAAIAQDWRNLAAEHGPSNFDQRHAVTAQVEYTTGQSVAGGALLTGRKGALIKGWTLTSQVTAGSGLPLTPLYLAEVPGTAITGAIRASVTGASLDAAPTGLYANPAAFTAPAPGQWGTAARNSLRGPAQFVLNAGIGRSFPWGDRLNLDWRIDATNVINDVTFAGVNTIVGSPQFGLPNRTNTMRKLTSTLRLRF